MGVDYGGNYGFGVEIVKNEEEDFSEWLDNNLEGHEEIYYFETGDESYSGEPNTFYACIDIESEIERTEKYDCLEEKAKKLTDTLDFLGIEYIGVPNIVGGLYIW